MDYLYWKPILVGYHKTRLPHYTLTDLLGGGGVGKGGGSSGQTCDKGGVFAPISISQQYLFVFRACVYLCSLFL